MHQHPTEHPPHAAPATFTLTPHPATSATTTPGHSATLNSNGQPIATLRGGAIDINHVRTNPGTNQPGTPGDALTASWSLNQLGNTHAWELTLTLTNTGNTPLNITRMDPLDLQLERSLGHWTTHWYRSAWGDEFRPQHGTTRHDTFLEVRSGRSSHGMSPWLGVQAEEHPLALSVTPAWSGNWHITAINGGTISAGISPWQFALELAPGETITAPSVVLAAGSTLTEASVALQRAVRDEWMPRTPYTDSLPVEWNSWWPYEDQDITEELVIENARHAHELGIEIATLDAGWFGAANATSDWQEERGDWDTVNTKRFPSGLEHLGNQVLAAGALPGIWIEAEAVGRSSTLRAERPELMAHSTPGSWPDPSYRPMTVSLDPEDPTFLGYVCLGSPAGRAHVLESMSTLVTRTSARWVKLDFNIDPDAGCTRTDHGHGAGDGLYRHVTGLYEVLAAFRERHPDVLLESCSSGGLRLDLGLARHVHGFFLSDPDYTEHHLETLMGASRLLPPLGILHWSQSQWRGDFDAQAVDWNTLPVAVFDRMVRAAMLHRFGVSLKLPELRPALRERLAQHVHTFRTELAPLVREGVLRPLTAPPERGGIGERTPVLQLSDETHDRHVVAAFQLPHGLPQTNPVTSETPQRVPVTALHPERHYRVRILDGGTAAAGTADSAAAAERSVFTGAELLTAGVPLPAGTPAREGGDCSWLLELTPATNT